MTTERRPDGAAILARNPFDSITGPLDGPQPVESTDESEAKNNENPYTDPICESVRVMLITTADDPAWSFAAIATGKEKASLRRIGDNVGQQVVLAMVWDRVWMQQGQTRCQTKLHGEMALAEPKKTTIVEGTTSRSNVPREISDKIRHIADHHYEVERTILDDIANKQRELLGSVRVTLAREADGPGLKLQGIRTGSLLGSLGLVNGDILQSINGFEMTDPMIAVQAYQRLLTADKLDVRIKRAGKPVSIDVNLR